MRDCFGGVGKKGKSDEERGLVWRMRGLRGKFCSRQGMSLTETLVAILLLSLFTMTAASGIGAAVRLHTQSVTFSEAQTLSSTLTQALTDELRYALHIKINSSDGLTNSAVVFDSLTYGNDVSVAMSEDGRILVGGSDLIPDKAYTSGLKADANVTYKEGLFSVTLVVKDQKDSALVSSTVTVRALNPYS